MTKLTKRSAAIHYGVRRSQYNELSEAIFLTQGFVYDSAEQAEARFNALGEDAFIYARYGNPSVAMFEDRMAELEGTEAGFATASGMAAVNGTLMALLQAGDHIVAARALFGSCLWILDDLLPRYGVEVTLVDGRNLDAWRAAIRPNTKVLFFETISNPTLEVVDVASICQIAQQAGATTVADNVFATPVYSQAIDLGVDVVIYSATKHIDGQGRALGGIVLGSYDFIRGPLETYMKHTGASMSPFTAWMMLKGLETLDLRVRSQTFSTQALAEACEARGDLLRVIYPGLNSHPDAAICAAQIGAGGTVMAIDCGSKDRAFSTLNALKLFKISNNLGDAKSIVTHPATTTHKRLPRDQKQALGISDGLLRISVGLEDPQDLISDMMAALG